MRHIYWAFFAALAVYSAVLVVGEALTSQQFIRHYFSDIEGGRPFFAINTTLSTFLLAGAGLLLVFAACAGRADLSPRTQWFLWTQAGMLAFLGFDDRFQLHEALAYRIGISDHFIMVFWAFLEGMLILAFARMSDVTFRSAALVAAGAGFFALMMVFDAIVPHDMVLRLSIEDLAKSWAAALFFAGAWELSRFHIGLDPEAQTLADWVARQRSDLVGTTPKPGATPSINVGQDRA